MVLYTWAPESNRGAIENASGFPSKSCRWDPITIQGIFLKQRILKSLGYSSNLIMKIMIVPLTIVVIMTTTVGTVIAILIILSMHSRHGDHCDTAKVPRRVQVPNNRILFCILLYKTTIRNPST